MSFRWVWLALVVVFLSGCPDSARQIQIYTAEAVARGANAGLPVLVQRYKAEGDAVILMATTRGDAEAGIAAVKAKWKPVWEAWEALRAAQDGWATALEKGGSLVAALQGVQVAYCGLQKVWPEDIPVVPLVPLKCGEVQ